MQEPWGRQREGSGRLLDGFLLEQRCGWRYYGLTYRIGEEPVRLREVEQEFRFGHADIEMPVKYPTRDVQRAVRVR